LNLKGNKGELSELYAFFHLLSEGKIYSADENLKKTKDFVEVLSINRIEKKKELNFEIRNGNITIIESLTGKKVLTFKRSDSKLLATQILFDINNHTRLQVNTQTQIINKHITRVKQKSTKKGDIEIRIYDPVHGISSDQEFSIKSFLGSDPTLFNANKTTNIIYRLTDSKNSPLSKNEINRINSITTGHKYIKRIKKLIDTGHNIQFHSYEDKTFKLNLQIIDSDLPKIIAEVVLSKYRNKITKIKDVVQFLHRTNPMNYDLSEGHKFYEYRIVNFLVEAALGMTSKTAWSGEYQVIGGIIIIKPDAETLCYHLIDFNKFKGYLKSTSRLDNPSGSKMGYGSLYEENGDSFIKLNFQIKA